MNIKIITATIVLTISSQASLIANADSNTTFAKSNQISMTDSKRIESDHKKVTFNDKSVTNKLDTVKGRNKLDFNHKLANDFKLNSLAYSITENEANDASSLKGRNVNITHFQNSLALYSSDQKGADKYIDLVIK